MVVAMRLGTWNINGMNARLDFLTRFLKEVQPDVLGLQELKMVNEKFPREVLREHGYEAHVHGQKAWNGVAVLVRKAAFPDEVRVLQRGLPGEDEFGARLITVACPTLQFTTVYCPNGKSIDHEDFARKLEWFDSLALYVKEQFRADDPHVLCGDFNIVPAPVDSWNEAGLGGHIFHTREERERLRALIDWGFTDAFRKRDTQEPGFTWWDYRGGAFHKGQGLRIDLMLLTASLAGVASEAVVERGWRRKVEGLIPSDHAPVWVDVP